MDGEERILSAKKERSFIKSSQKKALSLANHGNGHFCLHAIVKPRMFPWTIGKNGTEITSPIVASVAVITSLGKHVFSEEFTRKQRYRVVRPLVKANTCKNLYQ